MELKENDLVMCTVKSIQGTTVFVKIGENDDGSIVLSEVAAGRIRNLREHVFPEKKIVCKVLKIYPDHAELSLRRVTTKEKEEILLRCKKAKIFENVLKAALKNPEEVIKKIKENYEIWEFYDLSRETPAMLEKFMSKQEAETTSKMLSDKEEKEKIVKKIFTLRSISDSGLQDIKEILSFKDANIKYLGSSKFSIEVTAKDYKQAESHLNKIIKHIEQKAKEKRVFFEYKEK